MITCHVYLDNNEDAFSSKESANKQKIYRYVWYCVVVQLLQNCLVLFGYIYTPFWLFFATMLSTEDSIIIKSPLDLHLTLW